MTRLRLDLAYDGTDFAGWARQPGLRTVQGCVEDALAQVLRMPAAPTVTCAGRTDAGVHALGQVAHVDIEQTVEVEALERSLRGVLPEDIAVHGVQEMPGDFDARFAATWRRYAYRLCDDPASWNPLHRRFVVAYPRALDTDLMTQAGQALVGEHDFAALCKPREGGSTVRRVLQLLWDRDDSGLARMTVTADAFCHSMVRSIVGLLVPVGDGRQPIEWAATVLASGLRDPRVTVMPPHGLVLEQVGYPVDGEFGARQQVTRAYRGDS